MKKISYVSLILFFVIPYTHCLFLFESSPKTFIEAVEKNDSIAAQKFIDGGNVLETRTSNGSTCLHLASFHGHEAMSSLLIKAGANLNALDNSGWTPLHVAIFHGHDSVCKILCESGADTEVSNDHSKKPLHIASQSGKEVICKTLLSKGANAHAIDGDGWTPLHYACYFEYPALVPLLIDERSIAIKTSQGSTALSFAAEKNNRAIVELLLKKGAVIDEMVLEKASLALFQHFMTILIKQVDDDEKGSLDALLKRKDAEGKTILHREAERANPEKCVALLNAGALIDVVDKKGRTPLHVACVHNASTDRLRQNKPLQTIRILLGHQSLSSNLINREDNEGHSALHYVSSAGDHGVVAAGMLLDAGGDKNLRSKISGDSPWSIAQRLRAEKLLALFNQQDKK